MSMGNENSTFAKATIERPWMKYYPDMLKNIVVPECTLLDYLKFNCQGENLSAIQFYGRDITWKEVFEKVELVARSLKAIGLKEGDQLPSFLSSAPEFVYIMLAAEKLGVSILCRDNTLEENVEAAKKSGSKVMFAHDYLGQADWDAFLVGSDVEKVILVDTCYSCNREDLPEHNEKELSRRYPEQLAMGSGTMSWEEFLALGESVEGEVGVPQDTNRPLLCAYTSGSTGPSKQVIHSAKAIISVMHQMNFYSPGDGFRPTWMLTVLPPALIAVTVAMMFLPLASNKILILSPYTDPEDVDLELMLYRPNGWAIVPYFMETVMRSHRIPADYDLSHLLAAGAGAEALNNNQLVRSQQYVIDHNCNVRFTTGYGSSEAGSNLTLPMMPHPMGNGNVGVPMPLNVIGVFKDGTQEEVPYNTYGEICVKGPGMMLGYDNIEATAKALQTHEDGDIWLHTGDIGYMNEDGVIYVATRGSSPRFGGGDLAIIPMENLVADAAVEGIDDEFFVLIPDKAHEGCFLPYLYVVLHDGYTVADVEGDVRKVLEEHMQPVEIIQIENRPFFHFKTNRIGLAKELFDRV